MAGEWVIRGVPRALAADMWWMSDAGGAEDGFATGRTEAEVRGTKGRGLALAGLIALADVLFWRHAPGLSLAVFAGAVLTVAMTLSPRGERLRPALLLLAAALPVVEFVQALSLAFLGAGLLVSLVWVTGGMRGLGRRAAWLAADLPWRGTQDGIRLIGGLATSDLVRGQRRQLRSWAFPVGGALVLLALLVEANPVLEDALLRLLSLDLGEGDGVLRLAFWTGMALLIWPLIATPRTLPAAMVSAGLRLPGPNALSVARGLVVFNAILGVQTVMDAAYLWGGAALPEGMTAAEYAHRGAYPLLVTALLAGTFALAARPFAAEDRRLRGLLLLWLAQNVALTVSALLRLELYVEAFGLTYLRVHAAIWMGLVGAGLALTGWQVWRGLPNGWLVLRSVSLGLGTLYVACFVNFAAIIAAQNLARERYDGAYVCSLGPTALAAIWASGREVRVPYEYGGGSAECVIAQPRMYGWRDWGFRNWRVRRYLEGVAEGVYEDPRGG
jgi:Domain of unknown function (DUF4173)